MSKKGSRITIVLSWLLVIAWMIMIFSLSAQVADKSNDLSTGITEKIFIVVDNVFEDLSLESFNHYIRKTAHFSIYAVLGLLLMQALKRSSYTKDISFIVTLTIGIVYAISDEFHQSFVPGRGPSAVDVIIDTSGVLVGIVLFLLIFWRKDKL